MLAFSQTIINAKHIRKYDFKYQLDYALSISKIKRYLNTVGLFTSEVNVISSYHTKTLINLKRYFLLVLLLSSNGKASN